MAALIAVETVVIALLALLVVGLLRSHADILRALHDLGAGVGDPGRSEHAHPVAAPVAAPSRSESTAVADLLGTTPEGDAVSIAVRGTEHDTLVAFLTSGCLTCRAIWDALAEPTAQGPAGSRVVVVTRDAAEESASQIIELAHAVQVPVVLSSTAWDDFLVPVAPYFVYVEGHSARILGEGAAARWEQVVELVERARADDEGTRDEAQLARDRRERRRLRAWSTDRAREERADRELTAAGIEPGDPRLRFPPADRDEPDPA